MTDLDSHRLAAYARHMSITYKRASGPDERLASLFRNGRNQALRIPKDFELPGDKVLIRQEGYRLIVEPVTKPTHLADLLASWEPLEEDFPDVDECLPRLDDIRL